MQPTIEKGNTQLGVNAEVFRHLGVQEKPGFAILDIPCGQGSFLRAIRDHYRQAQPQGVDLFEQPFEDIKEFFVRGSSADWSFAQGRTFDVITCISGVMCFDNISEFFEKASAHLNPGGRLIVTNDNILTIRDRLSFLLLGRVRRFKKIYSETEGNWNVMLIQALWKLYRQNGLEVLDVQYTSRRGEDYLLAPLILLFYPIEFLSLCLTKSTMPFGMRLKLFSPWMLISRHYVMVGVKSTS